MSSHPTALSDALGVTLPSPLQRITDERLAKAGVTLYLKRDDLISPFVPGNKWRKLKYNLLQAKQDGHTTLLTFGGAYSNHLRAVAAAGKLCGFTTIGIVRGEPHRPLNWSLAYTQEYDMKLVYLDRDTYRHDKTKPTFLQTLCARYGSFYLLPEGGSNALALRGCQEIVDEITVPFDIICCGVGTGGTIAGIAAKLLGQQQVLGFASLKGGDFLNADVARLQQLALGKPTKNWSINTDYHCGGFAKKNPQLDTFITDFYQRHGLQLEQVYVAKMMYGLFDLIQRGSLQDTTIIAVITGS